MDKTLRPRSDPIVERSEQREERELIPRKRQRAAEPSVPDSTKAPTSNVPLLEGPSRTPSSAYLEEQAIAQAETSRVRQFFGRDPEKVARVRRTDPNCSPMVLDFLASNSHREPCDVPHYVSRAITNLPRAWTTDLDAVAP
ncbi:hypothetical protein OROGR_023548 [Orobanche gracilis]